MIDCQHISKSYLVGDQLVPVLHEIDFAVEAGDFVAIVGASGSGKSTLMNIIGLLDSPTSGHYYFQGEEVAQYGPNELAKVRNQDMGFIFQNFALLPQYPVWYNVGLPLHYRTSNLAHIKEQANYYLEQVGLVGVADRYPQTLSGGQQQRVACARALITQPQVILADEPTGALDSHTSSQCMAFLQHLNITTHTTIIIITHDDSVAAYAKQIWRMQDGVLQRENRGGV